MSGGTPTNARTVALTVLTVALTTVVVGSLAVATPAIGSWSVGSPATGPAAFGEGASGSDTRAADGPSANTLRPSVHGERIRGPEQPGADRAPPELPERWQETYGGTGDEVFADLVRTADGGYLAVGWAERDGSDDGWLVKVDGGGDRQWTKTFGGAGTDRFWGAARTDDGYLLAGRTDEDGTTTGWIVEVGPDGEVTDERTPGAGAFYAIARDDVNRSDREGGDGANYADAGYLLAGMTYGEDGTVGWLLKLDGDGGEAWKTGIDTPEGYDDGRLRAVVPADAGYYLAGKAVGESDDGWALKVDSGGEVAWQRAVGGPDRDDVWAAAPARDSSGDTGFVLAGETESDSDGPRDGWLVKFDADGTVAWNRSPGGPGTQWLDSAMRTGDGFLFTGGSDRGPSGSADGYVLATDYAGQPRWESYYGTGAWDKPWPAIRAHGGGYLLGGKTTAGTGGGGDGWLVRIGGSADRGNATDNDGNGTATPAGTPPSEGTTKATGSDATGEDAEATTAGNTVSDAAMAGETRTATDAPAPIPGFGVGAAVAGLLAATLVALRRAGESDR